jgi:hypothetical protein
MKRMLIGVATGVFMLLGGIALASIPDNNGIIHGCYKITGQTKEVIVIDSPSETCPSSYTALNWNQTGPQGATGATGSTGPAGQAGAAGVSGYEIVQQDATVPANSVGDYQTQASCPVGKVAISGGLWLLSGQTLVHYINSSYPNTSNTREWIVRFHTENTFNFSLTARTYAVCAFVS